MNFKQLKCTTEQRFLTTPHGTYKLHYYYYLVQCQSCSCCETYPILFQLHPCARTVENYKSIISRDFIITTGIHPHSLTHTHTHSHTHTHTMAHYFLQFTLVFLRLHFLSITSVRLEWVGRLFSEVFDKLVNFPTTLVLPRTVL